MFTAVPAVITTRSPDSTISVFRARSERGRPELLDVGALGHGHRCHAPLERHVLQRIVVVGQADDRATRPQARDGRRRAAGEGRDEDRLRLERFRDVARGVRHRLADRGLLVCLRDLVAVVETRLHGPRDPVHEPHRLGGKLADGRLAGEHDRARPVEDRVGHVRRLGARRLGRVDHRLEHLRRRDHRLAALEGAQDDPLLQERHRDRTHLDPEIAACDHHRVCLAQDVVQHGDRLGLLDLRDHVRRRRRTPRSASSAPGRRTPCGRRRARRSRSRARARTGGRRCPSSSAKGSGAGSRGG